MAFSRLSHKFLSFSSSIIFSRLVILIPSQKKVVRNNDESGEKWQHPVLDPQLRASCWERGLLHLRPDPCRNTRGQSDKKGMYRLRFLPVQDVVRSDAWREKRSLPPVNFTKKERDLFFYPSTVNFLPQSAADRSLDWTHRNFWNRAGPGDRGGLLRSAGSGRSRASLRNGSVRRHRDLSRHEGYYRRCSALSVLLQSYKNNFWLKVPVNFNRNVPCSRNTFADRYIINQRFHNLAGKMFQVGILFNQFAAIIARRNFFFDFG